MSQISEEHEQRSGMAARIIAQLAPKDAPREDRQALRELLRSVLDQQVFMGNCPTPEPTIREIVKAHYRSHGMESIGDSLLGYSVNQVCLTSPAPMDDDEQLRRLIALSVLVTRIQDQLSEELFLLTEDRLGPAAIARATGAS